MALQPSQSWLRLLPDLCKVRVASAVIVSMAAGHILFAGRFTWAMWPPILGTFLLACGSFALNQLQERRTDALMARTEDRPLPGERMAPAQAAAWAGVLLLCGSALVFAGAGAQVLGLGWLCVFWYNGVYTRLKRRTAFAVVPGALVGAIPPVMGWVSAGGVAFAPAILGVALFIWVWQIPHFWLLLILHGKEYEAAGFPSPSTRFSTREMLGVACAGFCAVAATAAVSALAGFIPESPIARALVLLASIWLAWRGGALLRSGGARPALRRAFKEINAYALIVLILYCLDRMLL